jgi:hypothetical protein
MVNYNCIVCNYSTTRNSSFLKHLTTKKHSINEKNILPKNGKSVPKNGSKIPKNGGKNNNKLNCKYCDKSISFVNHLNRHYKTCKEKQKIILKHEKEEIIKKLEQETIKLKNELKIESNQLKKEQEEKKDMHTMYMEQIKLLFQNINKPSININMNLLNASFVINKFQDAYDYETLMEPELTAEEIYVLNNNSAINGCYQLLKRRCIDDIDVDKRPMHLVDAARKKYTNK